MSQSKLNRDDILDDEFNQLEKVNSRSRKIWQSFRVLLQIIHFIMAFIIFTSSLIWLLKLFFAPDTYNLYSQFMSKNDSLIGLLILSLIFIIYLIPIWIIISLINYFTKLFIPIKYSYEIGILGILTIVSIDHLFNNRIDLFFKWLD